MAYLFSAATIFVFFTSDAGRLSTTKRFICVRCILGICYGRDDDRGYRDSGSDIADVSTGSVPKRFDRLQARHARFVPLFYFRIADNNWKLIE